MRVRACVRRYRIHKSKFGINGRVRKFQFGAAPNLILREMTLLASNDYYLLFGARPSNQIGVLVHWACTKSHSVEALPPSHLGFGARPNTIWFWYIFYICEDDDRLFHICPFELHLLTFHHHVRRRRVYLFCKAPLHSS